ncbi:MAG: hypothetical protein ACHQ3P_10385 [Candidatus Limnocylindrales bacterium]
MRIIRRVGIALGSLVIAWLVVSLIGGAILGPAAFGNPWVGLVVIVLGGLVFVDIVRRERRQSAESQASRH